MDGRLAARRNLALALALALAPAMFSASASGSAPPCPSPFAPIPMYYLVFQCGVAALGTTSAVDFPCNTYCEPLLHLRGEPSGALVATTAEGEPFVSCVWTEGKGGCDVWAILELTSARIDSTLTMTGGDGLIVIQWQSF